MRRLITASAVAVLAAVTLVGCADNGKQVTSVSPGPTPTQHNKPAPEKTQTPSPTKTPSSGPTATSTPTSKPTATPTAEPIKATVPNDCKAVVPTYSYNSFFKDVPLNDPGVVGTPDSEYYTPNGAITPKDSSYPGNVRAEVRDRAELRCVWRDPRSDISGLTVEVAHLKPELAQSYQAQLKKEGYTVKSSEGGQLFQQSRTDNQYSVDVTDTILFRDDLAVTINQANFPTSNLLGAVVGQIWK